ncbi:hypothetical protein [Natronoglomus mannanivorans]|uniref:Uncharacterized protein n=1 Tax=Natronoglomus mannanivorans TaxID=2979990 RepID=A0AAP3E541_9EURY|nr:hypothetical protein [Halobacteria archaeon AArc-xg1-1]
MLEEDSEAENEQLGLPDHRFPMRESEIADIRYKSWDNQDRIGELEATVESQRERIEKLEIRVDAMERLYHGESVPFE